MSEVAQLFGARAGAYANFRPEYPAELFAWLAEHSPGHQRALDIACGNGQASRPLRPHFHQVLACDASAEQLAAAGRTPGLTLFAADAAALPLADASLDLVVVAQALHWFAGPPFFAEMRRVLKPDGLFCAWCYSLMTINPQLDPLIARFHGETLKDYWPAGRSSVDAGYSDIPAPFPRLEVPAFAIVSQWSFEHLLGYLGTWSAVQRWEQAHGLDPVATLAPDLRQAWGDINQPQYVQWPLHFIAGFPNQ